MADNEKLSGNQIENLNTLSDNADKHAEALRSRLEKERSGENRAEKRENAQHEVEAAFESVGGKKGNVAAQPRQSIPAAQPIKKATKSQKETEYKKTLKSIQKNMNPAEKTFSKVIHNPVIEKTSDIAGATVARPAALLAGSIAALVITSVVYVIADHYGYRLSGSEWIATFILGWLIGLIIDWVRVALLGKKAGPA